MALGVVQRDRNNKSLEGSAHDKVKEQRKKKGAGAIQEIKAHFGLLQSEANSTDWQ